MALSLDLEYISSLSFEKLAGLLKQNICQSNMDVVSKTASRVVPEIASKQKL